MIDQAEVIELARQAIEKHAAEVRRHRAEAHRWSSSAGAMSGYLEALRDNKLVSVDVFYQLKTEADRAVVTALSPDC